MTRAVLDRTEMDAALRATWPGLRSYVVALLGGRGEHADDVMQETALYLWNHRERLDAPENFPRWAFRVAYFHAKSKRRDLARAHAAVFGEEFFERLAEAAEPLFSAESEARLRALRHCVAEVPEAERTLLVSHYGEGRPLTVLAKSLGLSADAMHQRASRLRRALRTCMKRRIAEPETNEPTPFPLS